MEAICLTSRNDLGDIESLIGIMSRYDPASTIIGLVMAMLSPFIRVCDRFISGILALVVGIAGVFWACYVTIPAAINNFTGKVQIAQFVLNFLQGFTAPTPSQDIFQPISPFFGVIGLVFCLLVLHHFRYEIMSIL